MAIEISDKDFEKEVVKSDKPVLVDFWAPWCGPCQIMIPVLEDLSKEMGDRIKIVKVNVDNNNQTASSLGIMSIPTLIIFKEGKVVKQFVGAQSIEVLRQELSGL